MRRTHLGRGLRSCGRVGGDSGGLLSLFCLVIGLDLGGSAVFGQDSLHAFHLIVPFLEFQEVLVALGFALFRFKAKLLVDLVIS